MENLVQKTLEAFAKITILVNNAGGGGPKPFDMPMDDFIWAYKLNVFSAFRLCQETAKAIEAATGNEVLGMGCNVTVEAEVQSCVAETVKAFGGVSTLVNNVGWGRAYDDPLAEPEEDMIESYKLNTLSARF